MSWIYRYEIPSDEKWHEVQMEAGSPVLAAASSPGVMYFWAMAGGHEVVRKFRVCATGHPIENGAYRASVPYDTGHGDWRAWHLFEKL